MQFFFRFSSIASGAQSSKNAHFTAFSPQILHLTADSREKRRTCIVHALLTVEITFPLWENIFSRMIN